MSILDQIMAKKAEEVVDLTANQPTFDFVHHPISVVDCIQNDANVSIIAEIKRASPSKGPINLGVNPIEQAQIYEAAGAQVISVLTDQTYFKGSFDDLATIRQHVSIPLLCKDFIRSRIQIDVAKSAGADMILLIVAALDDETLHDLHSYATSLELDVLVEVHNLEEVGRANALNAAIIGINNRDLKTFSTDLSVTESLVTHIHPDALVIGESGIYTTEDTKRMAAAGVDGVLIGESLMKSAQVQQHLTDLKQRRQERTMQHDTG